MNDPSPQEHRCVLNQCFFYLILGSCLLHQPGVLGPEGGT